RSQGRGISRRGGARCVHRRDQLGGAPRQAASPCGAARVGTDRRRGRRPRRGARAREHVPRTRRPRMIEKSTLERGVFTLSLDFELLWGTRDLFGDAFKRSCEIERAVVIARLLDLLAKYGVRATWCVVGHLFLSSCRAVDGKKHPELVAPRHAWCDDWLRHDP